MAKKKSRMSIEFRDLIDRINTHRSDPLWQGLAFAARVRALVEIALNVDRPGAKEITIAKIVADYWNLLADSEVDLSVKRLKLLREGECPDEQELEELAAVLPIEFDRLIEIRARTFPRSAGSSGVSLSDKEQRDLLAGFLNTILDTKGSDGYSLAEIAEVLERKSDRDIVWLVRKIGNGNGSKTHQEQV